MVGVEVVVGVGVGVKVRVGVGVGQIQSKPPTEVGEQLDPVETIVTPVQGVVGIVREQIKIIPPAAKEMEAGDPVPQSKYEIIQEPARFLLYTLQHWQAGAVGV